MSHEEPGGAHKSPWMAGARPSKGGADVTPETMLLRSVLQAQESGSGPYGS